MHDGSVIRLKKLGRDYDPTSRVGAIELLEQARDEQTFITGLIYINQQRSSLTDLLHLTDQPLVHLPQEKLRPPRAKLDELMAGMA